MVIESGCLTAEELDRRTVEYAADQRTDAEE
jgi:hypothetical protein